MKTRGKGSKGSTKPAEIPVSTPQNSAPKVQLGPESNNPPQLFILPKDASTDARIVSLANPRNLAKTRYLVCPEHGVYEFTRVAAPKTLPRSLLLTPPCLDSLRPTPSLDNELSKDDIELKDDPESSSKGYVLRTADLFITTPIDPLFLMLPVLSPTPSSKGPEPTKRLFLSGDDYFDNLISTSPQLSGLMKSGSLRSKLEARMAAVCDTVEGGDETMYRLNEEKLLSEMVQKATKMIQTGLPPSMEEKLVRKALEVPMLSIKREDSSMHELAKEEDESGSTSFVQTPDTQSSTTSTETAASSVSEASTAATSLSESSSTVNESTKSTKSTAALPPINAPDGIAHLLRFRTAILFICSSYLAPHISELLKNMLASPTSTIDFGPLDAHLTHLTKLRQDALAARSLGDFSRKRALDEDAESGETRADKKRKKEEEEKRKRAGESRGVKNLKKVDVSGMKKMTSFFTKK